MGHASHWTKSLLIRFKGVSKEWYNVISRGALSRKILPPLMSGLLYQTLDPEGYTFVSNSKVANGGDMDLSLSFLPSHQRLSIVNCCNGLLLCRMGGSDWNQNQEFLHYIVCNPTTKKWVSLPKVHKSSCINGLVYDPLISDQFKVVRFLCCSPETSSIELQIFSSKTGKWVETTVFFGSPCYFWYGRQVVFSNGSLHVLFYPHHVLKYDIKKESCRLIELPPEVMKLSPIDCLGESCGYLHYAERDTSTIKIWMLVDWQRSEWVLKHCIIMQALRKQFPHSHWFRFNFLAFHPDLEVVFLEAQGFIFSYHLNSSKLEKFWTVTQEGVPPFFTVTCVFSRCIDSFAH
ncbi:F-box protein At5g07610-like [Tasmannia lanceolata]|uniref:F-box protein At5g07610-like n=1 Tax=Tasmannia lanceolata TaxID=3420 RepID=UPI0040635AFA